MLKNTKDMVGMLSKDLRIGTIFSYWQAH